MYTLIVVPIEDHTSKSTRDHVKDVITSFSNKRFGEINLHTVHNGARNITMSDLLNMTFHNTELLMCCIFWSPKMDLKHA